jgi:N-acyl-D-amino-acid deacylase
MRLSRVIALALLATAPSGLMAQDLASATRAAEGSFDLLIEDALLVDGTGAPPVEADILVEGDRIAFIGDVPKGAAKAARTIAAAGRTLSPGFIDTHTHADPLKESFDGFLAMGVTTVILGQDGRSATIRATGDDVATPAEPLGGWLKKVEAKGVQLNVAVLSGHGSLRHMAGIPDSARALTAEQQRRMNDIMSAELADGSFGLSTGLEYVPGRYAETAELVPLAKRVADADGVIISHMRTEDDGLVEGAVQELVDYGGKARIQASHLKIVFGKGPQTARRLLDFIGTKQREGARLSADVYPYTAGYGGLGLIFPEWALPPADYAAVVKARRTELLDYLKARMTKRGGPTALLFGSAPIAGKTLADVAAEQGKPFEQVLLDLGPNGAHGAHFIMDEALQDLLVVSPLTAISTDGGPSIRHPRGTGTYARLIEYYVEQQKALSLQEAVRKSSSLPAAAMGFTDRGVVRVGAKADLLLFDPRQVRAKSDYLKPYELAQGFDVVIVNGRIARENGVTASGRYGQVLRRAPSPEISK